MAENFIEKLQLAYIKNIKRHMVCPSCGDRLTINKKGTLWECKKCGYGLSHKDFEKGYIFWFCDKCNTFLNNQDGFDSKRSEFCCTSCGHKNDISAENIKDICKDCGTILEPGSKFGLCPECLKLRTDKWKGRLKTGLKIVGGLAAIAGVLYLAATSTDDTDSSLTATDTNGMGDDAGLRCANCGNTDENTLHDEGDTIYCSRCCHRTRVDTHEDDLVECPYCHYMRDRKALYCRHCNIAWGAEVDEEETKELRKILQEDYGYQK